MGLLRRVIGGIAHSVKTVGKYVAPVAKFIGRYHQPLTQVAHGLAMASGHEGIQKVTGGLLAVSNMAAVRQGLNQGNARVAQAMQSNGGRAGVFNHTTGTLT